MDTTLPGVYRGFALNDAAQSGPAAPISGCEVNQVRWGGAPGVGYTEKRAQADGNDSADVLLGPRRIQLVGTLYGLTRADLYDRMQALRAAFTPTLAYAESPETRGYLPFSFSEPTENTADFPTGVKAMFINVRPEAQPTFDIIRKQVAGKESRGLAIPWSVALLAEDPTRFLDAITSHTLATQSNITLPNRGDYPAVMSFTLTYTSQVERTFHFVGFGSDLTITAEANPETATYDFDGRERLLWQTINGERVLRMDLLTLDGSELSPAIPPGGGEASWTTTGVPTGSMFWIESFA